MEKLKVQLAPQRICDLGTGTGALALALATEYPEAEVVAVDFSGEAAALASENVERLGLSKQVTVKQGSWFEPLSGMQPFDLIVSNPPYLTEAEMTTAQAEVVDHEPIAALVSGADGLDDLRVIIKSAPMYLAEGGLLVMETGIAQQETLGQLANEAGLKSECFEDMSGRPRFFFGSL